MQRTRESIGETEGAETETRKDQREGGQRGWR